MIWEIVEENNYYPFGLRHKGYNNVVNGTHHPYTYNGKEEQDELGLNWIDYGARNYDASIGRWMNLDPLAEVYHTDTPYAYVLNNPLSFIDPDGREVIGVTKDDAKKAHDDINTVFADKKFDDLRALFTRGKKDNKKAFDKIDGDALKSALSGLSGDDLALAELVTGAINSKDVHKVEFAETSDNLSSDGTTAFNGVMGKLYTDNGIPLPTMPTTRTGNDIKATGTSGLNMPTTDGSHSVILEGTGITNSGGRREIDTFHEVFGHGFSTAKKVSNQVNNTNAIRTENLVRRVLGIQQQRSGVNHAGGTVTNPSALPTVKN